MATNSILRTWADRAGLTTPSQGAEVVEGWGGMDFAWEIRRSHDRYAVVKVERSASIVGTFSDVESAEKVLLLKIAAGWRSDQRLPHLSADSLATGFELDEGPASTDLRWSTGDAEFATGRPGRFAALDASRVLGHSLASVSAALERPDGGALFS